MEFSVGEIAAITAATVAQSGATDAIATAITWDSRDVAPGTLFVALPGERTDGHNYIEGAVEAGAVAVIGSREPNENQRRAARAHNATLFTVEDGAAAIVALAAAWRRRLRALVIAITGSSGKTTTKNFTREVLARRWRIHATAGNQNNELGVPKTILDAPLDCQVLLLELGISAPGEMAMLTEMAKPDWGVIVSIGSSHLEFLRDERTVAWEKSQLWRALPPTGRAFGALGDPWTAFCLRQGQVAGRVPFELFGETPGDTSASTIGVTRASALAPSIGQADARLLIDTACGTVLAEAVTLDELGRPSFTLVARRGAQTVRSAVSLQLAGRHNVIDACAAAAVGLASEMTIEDVASALSATAPEAGRSEILKTDTELTIINDAYNANPSSTKAVLQTLSALSGAGRRFAVLGDMGELGDAGPDAHRAIGAFAATLPLDGLICVGELSALTAEAARDGGMDDHQVWEYADAEQAADALEPLLAPGDVVLVKASRFVGLDRLVKRLRS